jgi:hypothetical protein
VPLIGSAGNDHGADERSTRPARPCDRRARKVSACPAHPFVSVGIDDRTLRTSPEEASDSAPSAFQLLTLTEQASLRGAGPEFGEEQVRVIDPRETPR